MEITKRRHFLETQKINAASLRYAVSPAPPGQPQLMAQEHL